MQSHSFYNRYPIADTRAPIVAKTRERLKHLGVSGDSRLLVAVSGGPDSLALTHVLQSMRRSGAFGEMTVAHVNHGIRKEAAQLEEEVVREYCRNWNVPIEVKRMDTMNVAKREKKGIEETARKQRYAFFEELVQTHGFDFVLTAHTANDQAETVLMHLVRGAGVRGLAGIPPKRKLGSAWLLRPWLSITRNEILEYVQEFHLAPMLDASNDDLSFQRNRVRHKVMPVLVETWPDRSPVRAIAALAERMRELSKFLEGLAVKTLAELREEQGLSLVGLKRLRSFELHAVLEAWIAEAFGPFSISSSETVRIAEWLNSKSRALELRRGLRFQKNKTIVELTKHAQPGQR